jgi:hypothetical protein
MEELAALGIFEPYLVMEVTRMGVEVVDTGASACLSNLVVGSGLLAWIRATRFEDPECTKIRLFLRHKGFALRMMGCSPISDECVSKDEGLKNEISSKTHHSPYTVHPGSTKMYKDQERLGLEFSTYLSSSSLQATFGMPLYEALHRVKC